MNKCNNAPPKVVKFCELEGMTCEEFFNFVKQNEMWQALVLRHRGFGRAALLDTLSWLDENDVRFNNNRPAYPKLS